MNEKPEFATNPTEWAKWIEEQLEELRGDASCTHDEVTGVQEDMTELENRVTTGGL